MTDVEREDVSGVLNVTTLTVHEHETGAADLQTVCGHTHHVEHERLRAVGIEQATEEFDARKCGECFEDGRGY